MYDFVFGNDIYFTQYYLLTLLQFLTMPKITKKTSSNKSTHSNVFYLVRSQITSQESTQETLLISSLQNLVDVYMLIEDDIGSESAFNERSNTVSSNLIILLIYTLTSEILVL